MSLDLDRPEVIAGAIREGVTMMDGWRSRMTKDEGQTALCIIIATWFDERGYTDADASAELSEAFAYVRSGGAS